jgi:UDP-glucose 4-epimerase
MRKILVTGGAGFIGSHLCEKLLSEHRVVCIDNLSTGRKENIAQLRSNKNFTFHQVDILDQKSFENVFRTHTLDVIFHLAANSDIQSGDPQSNFRDTFASTCVVLEKCRIRGIKELIFASSGAIYGETKGKINEDYGPLLPISHYAAAKLSSEAFISSYSSMYDIKSFICRLPSVIGEKVTHGILYDFMEKKGKKLKVLGDGNQTKPYMYVKDLVDAMIFIWQNAKEKINYFNIAGLGQTSVREIAEMYVEKTGQEIEYAGGEKGWIGDVTFYDPSITKLGELGWVPKRTSNKSVEYAIKKT